MPSRKHMRKRRIEQMDTYQYVSQLPLDQQIKYLEKIGKKNNSRMRRLEAQNLKPQVYKIAMADLMADNRRRFREKIPTGFSPRQIDLALREAIFFNEAKESTVSGYKKGWKKRIATLRETRPYLNRFTDSEIQELISAGIASGNFADSETELELLQDYDGYTADEIAAGYEELQSRHVNEKDIPDVMDWEDAILLKKGELG